MMKNWSARLVREKIRELGELDFGHVVAVLITSVGFLLFLVCAIPGVSV